MELTVRIKKQLREFTLEANFSVKNEVFALLGASGCGKSMTLKCIAGIETPDEGSIVLNGRILYDSEKGIHLPPQRRRVGYLFQNYALFPNMTIRENILFVATGSNSEKKRKCEENITRFKLTGLENAYPSELSGGQQQRAAFARILASDAELLLLDEPFSALDSYLKWQLELELLNVLPSYDCTALLVSHDRSEVFRLAEHIAVIQRGKIEAIDSKHALFRNPRTLAALLLTGCKNVSSARKEDDTHFFAEDWQLRFQVNVPIPDALHYAGIRAHFLEYRTDEGENTFLMEVVQVIEDTFSYLVMLRHKGSNGRLIRWELEKTQWRAIQASEIRLHFPANRLMLLER